MYRLTLIPIDGAVYYKELETDELRIWLNLDLSFIPIGVHALQWHIDSGWIEHDNSANEDITVLPDWANEAIALALSQPEPPRETGVIE